VAVAIVFVAIIQRERFENHWVSTISGYNRQSLFRQFVCLGPNYCWVA